MSDPRKNRIRFTVYGATYDDLHIEARKGLMQLFNLGGQPANLPRYTLDISTRLESYSGEVRFWEAEVEAWTT